MNEPDDIHDRIAASFAKQGAMRTIGATLGTVEPGRVTIRLEASDAVGQQHGFVHGGVVAMVADSAGGYAALTTRAEGEEVLTIEYKINFLAPARGPVLEARGRVVKAGRRIVVAAAEVFGEDEEEPCAVAQITLTTVRSPA